MPEREPKNIEELDQENLQFLNERGQLDCSSERAQLFLRQLRGVMMFFYPDGRTGSTSLDVSSERLVVLGQVTETIAKEILTAAERKASEGESEGKGKLENRVIIDRRVVGEEEVFTIRKTYLSEDKETLILTGRKDTQRVNDFVAEVIGLRYAETGCQVTMERIDLMEESHIHRGELKYKLVEGASESKKVTLSAKDLNRTLVLILEGVREGIFTKTEEGLVLTRNGKLLEFI